MPTEIRQIVILADNDESGEGRRVAEAAASRLRDEGREVVIAMPAHTGDDFNDLLLREGVDAVAAVVDAVLAQASSKLPTADDDCADETPIGDGETGRPRRTH